MDETIYVIFKVHFDFALEVWFSIFENIMENENGAFALKVQMLHFP